MLSVCIPVFEVDVRQLAEQLAEQISRLEIPAEALFFDDHSGEKYRETNRTISEQKGIHYHELGENCGRAAIRNLLGKSAIYDWLLFLDGDSLLPDNTFLQKYVDALSPGTVFCGGTRYAAEPPADKSTRLRWKYGVHREQLTAEKRDHSDKFAITANNFMIERSLFYETGFRESIREYGHEDTVFGYDLFLKGIPVRHIDNPVIHNGLEPSADYLRKTGIALRNLLYIRDHMIRDPHFERSSGLLRRLRLLEKSGLTGFISFLFKLVEPALVRHLTGPRPTVLLFDMYRIGYLCRCRNRK